MVVLALTAHDDDTAARVCDALEARGHDYARMDLGDFPEKLSFTASGPGPDWVHYSKHRKCQGGPLDYLFNSENCPPNLGVSK